jgi:hypothetical protein
MAESTTPDDATPDEPKAPDGTAPPPITPAGPSGGAATPPKVAPWLVVYTLGRIVIAAVLVTVVWVAGLGGIPALLWGLLLSVPVSYLALRPVRDRLTEALAARSVARAAAKEDLRARLSGAED